MSQEQLQALTEEDEAEGLISNPLRLYTANKVEEQELERKLQNFYNPLPVECCGFRQTPPDKTPIANEKTRLGLPFVNQFAKDAAPQLLSLNDGIYQTSELEKFDTMNLHRLQTRLCRDSRQEYFKSNGEMIVNREFFDDKVSRLVNISFEANPALSIYQKNAILSYRSNQNKSQPFQIELVIGQVSFHQHPLMNDQQKKFQQLRPALENLQKYVSCPQLPHLAKVIRELKDKHRKMEEEGSSPLALGQVADQIAREEAKYTREGDRMQVEMRKVLDGWNQIKAIRKAQGSITVPWKISVKEYKYGEHTEYEIGLTTIPVTEKLDQIKPSQQTRRLQMQKQKYFMRLIINNNVVSTSSKVQMTWPYFSLPVYQKFNMFVYTMPSSVKLQIVKDGIISTVIDTINLKLPGQHANTITASQRRLISESFASNGQAVRRKKEEPSGYVGEVGYKIQWKGQGPKMPPSNITISDEVETAAETTVQDEEENMDVNDPRRVERNKKIGKKQTVQVERTSKESVLPFDGIISTRQFLLKARGKNTSLHGKKIPLTQQAIRKRQDLMQVIEQERQANIIYEGSTQNTYNPLQGIIFQNQPQPVKRRIREILNKINDNKHVVSTGAVGTSYKYRLVDQIVNEYTFEQMVSPIVVFFQDLFTQKRKLGPRKTFVPAKKENVTELQVTLYFASATNVPTREKANNILTKYRKTRNQMARQVLETIGMMNGLSLFQQPPNLNPQSYQYYNNPTGNMQMARRTSYGQPQFGRPQIQVDYNNELIPNIQRVSTFIEIHYKKAYSRTSQAEGLAPEWNQSLTFLFNMKQENSSLEQMFFSTAKKITVNMFDLLEKSEATDTMMDIKIRKHRTFLGSIQIPISTLISLPSITGSFKLKRPLVIFGYTSIQQPILTDVGRQQQRIQNPSIGTYINLDLSLSPNIDNSIAYNSDRKFFSGQQDPLFLQHANDWLEQLNLKRYIRLWLNNLDGNSTFISRFLCDIEPPPLRTAENPERTIQRTARFVSLIPHKSVCKILENTEEFHMTSQQFLDVKMGDDHAILLCNYFNRIDKDLGNVDYESYVIIGKAFPEGKTMYVLRLDKTTLDFELWNPRTGEPYSYNKELFETVCCCFTVSKGLKTNQLNKDICPLVEVGCIVSSDNVYVNLQPSANPGEISYDLKDDKLWKPFLTERSRTELFAKKPLVPYQGKPIQREFYQIRNPKVKDLQGHIRSFICGKMTNQRRNMIRPYTFRVNEAISQTIRNQMLLQLQTLTNDFRLTGNDSKFYSAKQKSQWPTVMQQLDRLKSMVKNDIEQNKEFYGFPLNFSYTTVEDIWEKVNMTQIHTLEKEDLEFVIAVRTFEHPCFLTSVWVFLGILIVVD